MNTPQQLPPTPPYGTPHHYSARTRKFTWIAVATGLVASIVSLVIMYVVPERRISTPTSLDGYDLYVSANEFPAPDAYRVTDGKLVTFSIPEQGTANLYDYVPGKDASFALLSGPEKRQVTLYERSLDGSGLQAVSDSVSQKVYLSADAITGTGVYEEEQGNSRHVIFFTASGKSLTDLGEGTAPTLLAGGSLVIYQRAEGIYLWTAITQKSEKLLDLPPGSLVAVSAAGSLIAVYDPVESAIMQYLIIDNAQLSEAVVNKALPAPQALFYAHNTLYKADMAGDVLTLAAIGGSETHAVSAPGFSLANAHISAYEK